MNKKIVYVCVIAMMSALLIVGTASAVGDFKPLTKNVTSNPFKYTGVTSTVTINVVKSNAVTATVPYWSKSKVVGVVDDFHSDEMGDIYPSDYPNQTFYELSPSMINASTLSQFDTIILFAFDPSQLTSTQKTELINWVYNGGKLIIWPGEEAADTPGGFDFSWLPYPFTTSNPGAWGASNYPLWIVEDNALSSDDPNSPYYINTNALANLTDAVGDADVFVSYSSNWYVDMMAKNALGTVGPVHAYAPYGHGIIIYCGLDWDFAGWWSGWDYTQPGVWLKKLLKQELELTPAGLNYTTPWIGQVSFNITVKTDKQWYTVGDPIKFTIIVTNTGNATAYNVTVQDYLPSELTTSESTVRYIGTMLPNTTVIITLNATAVSTGTVTNTVKVIGTDAAGNIIGGTGSVTFTIANVTLVVMTPGTVTIGKTFPVYINIQGVTNLASYQFDVVYDPSVIQFVSASKGSAISSWGIFSYSNVSANTVRIVASYFGGTAFSGSGTIAVLTFNAVNNGTSPIGLTNAVLSDTSGTAISFDVMNGTVTVKAYKPGDVNGDGNIDVLDLTHLVNIILGKEPKCPAADVNGDGNIDVLDLTALVNMILHPSI